MKNACRVASIALACLIPASAWAVPDPDPDPNAAVVLLRQDCGNPALENCFESMSALTTTGTTGWIWETRQPTASAPLLVDIGPGEFASFKCGDGEIQTLGYVTLRGSGREHTILKDPDPVANGIEVFNCNDLSFIDLGAHGKYGAHWWGTGSSSWSNVDLVGIGGSGAPVYATAGWLDDGCTGIPSRGTHYFHGSRIRAVPSGTIPLVAAFRSLCAENWIFGGEVFVDASVGNSTVIRAVEINSGFVETFGTAIRVRISGSATVGTSELFGVVIQNGLPNGFPVAFHSHGTNIGLSADTASQTNLNVVAISATQNVVVHSPATAYALKPGSSGTATRLRVTGSAPKVEAPYQWSAATAPPTVASRNGEDLFVETDCTSTGCTGTGGSEPHLMIYAPTACSGSPWWDVSRNACRQ